MTAGSRDKFSSKIEFLLTGISYAVGLGNIWRFPYLCYKNGGGSFLIPYMLSLVFLGLPFFLFESTLGQYTNLGTIKVWKLAPLFKGIGAAMFLMNVFCGIYYNMVVAWSLYYLYASFTALPSLPWANCNNTWNTVYCFESELKQANISNFTKTLSPSQEYFYNQVLQMTDGIDNIGSLRPHLVLCLAIAWIVVFFGLSLGAKSLGKISYFTAIFPYVMITALLCKGLQLEGAMEGILHYIKPDFQRLTMVETWSDAATQIFFSLSITMGGVITLASYNNFYNNTFRDSLLIVVANSMTSIYAGFAIFSVIGFMAKQIDKPIDQAVDRGVGLAFVAYPSALARLPYAPIWSIVFFITLITLGLGTILTITITITSTIIDFSPSRLQKHKIWVLALVCFLMFSCGLPMTTGAGIYILQLMDSYAVPYSAFIIGFFEIIAIAWVYGIERHLKNIQCMMGANYLAYHKIIWLLSFIWKYCCPVIIVVILGLVIQQFAPLTINDYTFPICAEYFGWALSLSSVVMIPIFAVYELSKVLRGQKTLQEILRPEIVFHHDEKPETEKNLEKLATDLYEGQVNDAYVNTEQLDYIGPNHDSIFNDAEKSARLTNFSVISTWKRSDPLKP